MNAVLAGVGTIKAMVVPSWQYRLKQSMVATVTDVVAQSMASSVGERASDL